MIARAIRIGFVSGAVVLGLLGRLASAMLARILGEGANLSASGLLEVTLLGGIVGALGGIVVQVLRARMRSPGGRAGLIGGVVIFGAMAGTAVLAGWLDPARPAALAGTLGVVAALCLFHGVIVDVWLSRSAASGNQGRNP